MKTEAGDRLMQALPAVYSSADVQRHDLRRLLAVFEKLLFDDLGTAELIGIERRVNGLPALFVPSTAPAAFVRWTARWLGFTPHSDFDDARLRRIVPGLVPLYGRRGTRRGLVELLSLCFDEVDAIDVDDRPPIGFIVGLARVGSTRLEQAAPFRFTVRARPRPGQAPTAALERRLRAVIDFAKPAHTRYELSWADADEPPSAPEPSPPTPHRLPAGSTPP